MEQLVNWKAEGLSFDEDGHLCRKGQRLPILGEKKVLCQQDTSYYGCILDLFRMYGDDGKGVIIEHYMQRGPDLCRVNIELYKI